MLCLERIPMQIAYTLILSLQFLVIAAAVVALSLSFISCAATHLSLEVGIDCLLAALPCTFEGTAAALSMALGIAALALGLAGFGLFVVSGRRNSRLRQISLICCLGPLWSLCVFMSGNLIRYSLYDTISKNNQCLALAVAINEEK